MFTVDLAAAEQGLRESVADLDPDAIPTVPPGDHRHPGYRAPPRR